MPVTFSRRLFLASAVLLAAPRPVLAATKRLVTIGAPVTEIVFALGDGALVAATDTTSLYPAEARDLPKVGYMRTLAAEGLLSLTPTHVLAQEGSGPAHVFDRLSALGVRVEILPETPSVEGLAAKIRTIAALLERQQAGETLIAGLDARFAEARPRTPGDGLNGQGAICLIHAGPGGLLAAGSGTVADALIRLAGGHNLLESIQNYRPLSVEAAIAAAPAILVVTRRMVDQSGGIDALLHLPQLAQTPVAASRRVAVIDDSLLLGMGPRTPEAVRIIADIGGGG